MLRSCQMTFAAVLLTSIVATNTTVLAQNQSEDELIAVLQSADASLHDKASACEQLAVVGSKKAVPVLAALLTDEKLSHYARFGLEPIPDASVDAALRDALSTTKDRLRIGVINSIGAREKPAALETLSKLLDDPDATQAAAAAAAIGRIGTPVAAKTLTAELISSSPAQRQAMADACLKCSDTLIAQGHREDALKLLDAVRQSEAPIHQRAAATRSAILLRGADGVALMVEQLKSPERELFNVGLNAARLLPGDKVTGAILKTMKGESPLRQSRLLQAAAERGDQRVVPELMKAAKSDSPDLQRVAALGLGKLGDAAAVPILVDMAVNADEPLAQVARKSLATLPGKAVDDAIVKQLTDGDTDAKLIALQLTGTRRIAAAIPALKKAADSSNQDIRFAALRALGSNVGVDDIDDLVARLIKSSTDEEKAALTDALFAATIRVPDRDACAGTLVAATAKAPAGVKVTLLELVAKLGGPVALKAMVDGAQGSDAAIQDATTRLLGEWMSVDAAPELLQLAKTLSDRKYQIRALRGYIRIARQLQLEPEERIDICRKALAAADRDDERKLVLEVLRRNPTTESLNITLELMNSPSLKNAAANMAIAISEQLVATDPTVVKDAMRQVLDAKVGAKTQDRVKLVLEKAAQ